ncbi:DUF2141 domain-containing protein [Neotamlana laminarinivorans]|uniref:DUF2141 domain-containing protein n=1 Tax=Neotamlana laminarinivorans TaxID=2883124 RepID=A0A9X1I1M6_9FLAO|nr:DUF2141 domain-containing protein [Tamlana laminarinivorans]MCB4798903.1 DUF2141 domain-containing protein [Tamlana laminarinivorans]
MKTLTSIILLTLSTFFGNAQESEEKGQSITVTIENITNNNGHVLLTLHNETTFMKAAPLKSEKSEIKEGKVIITFKNILPGTYAIIGTHDQNDNNRMDFYDTGMPKESYGVSNNPVMYGPPEFAQAKFMVTNKNLDLNITF